MIKRIFDIVASICGLIFTAPFTPFIALAIILEDGGPLPRRSQLWPRGGGPLPRRSELRPRGGGPVFVKLDRISKGKIIKVYKFRTMVRNAQEMKMGLMNLNERRDGPFFKIKNDPRLTKVGKFLRKFRLDEFPQFLNVLKGELSLVGPRPHEPEEIFQYPPEFKKLAMAKSGLTGLSQVSGASGLPFQKELELDLYYVEHRSFWLDLKILLKTVWIFFSDPTGV